MRVRLDLFDMERDHTQTHIIFEIDKFSPQEMKCFRQYEKVKQVVSRQPA